MTEAPVRYLANATRGVRSFDIHHDTDPVQGDAPYEDPFWLAREWLPANADPDRPQVTLSTIDPDGFPDARTVLMTEFDDEGFFFHTDAESRKVRHLALNPRASLVVLWPEFTRQLTIQGLAEVAPQDEIAAAFVRRSEYLKQLAWLNTADYAQRPLEERRELWARFAAEHARYPQPASWVGFKLRPLRMTFWVSNPDAASRRLEYRRDGDAWTRTYLPG
jgi:pyridoxamine 5'-phosphate oxidase